MHSAAPLFALNVEKMSDDQLMLEMADDQRDAWNELAKRYLSALTVWFIAKTRDTHRADDLAQTALLKAKQSAASYVNNREQYQNGKVSAWLFRVARSVLVDDVRRKAADRFNACHRTTADGTEWVAIHAAADEGTDDGVEHIMRHIRRLPAEQSDAFLRHHVGGHSPEAIARELGLPAGTIISRIRLAKEKLQDMLSKDAVFAEHGTPAFSSAA